MDNRALESMRCAYNFFTKDRLLKTLNEFGYEVLQTEDTEERFVTIPTINGNTFVVAEKT